MNITTWGIIVKQDQTENIIWIEFIKNESKYFYEIHMMKDHNHVQIKDNIYEDASLLQFTDHPENGSIINFTRKVKDMEYIYRDCKVIVKIENKNLNILNHWQRQKKLY